MLAPPAAPAGRARARPGAGSFEDGGLVRSVLAHAAVAVLGVEVLLLCVAERFARPDAVEALGHSSVEHESAIPGLTSSLARLPEVFVHCPLLRRVVGDARVSMFKKFVAKASANHLLGAGDLELARYFRIVKLLGKGGYATCYMAERLSDHRKYALKVTNVQELSPESAREVVREIRLLASLEHPNLVRYHEAFVDHGRLVVVMELLSGGDLSSQLMARRDAMRRLSEPAVWSAVLQVGMALQYLHRAHVAHRDVKPGNVLLAADGTLKLADLGIAEVLDRVFTRASSGTPHYMPPEFWREEPCSFSADVWALGCLLHELASLAPLFPQRKQEDLEEAVLGGRFPPLPPRYSADLTALRDLLLERDPAKRPTMDEVFQLPLVQRHVDVLPEGLRRGLSSGSLASAADAVVFDPRIDLDALGYDVRNDEWVQAGKGGTADANGGAHAQRERADANGRLAQRERADAAHLAGAHLDARARASPAPAGMPRSASSSVLSGLSHLGGSPAPPAPRGRLSRPPSGADWEALNDVLPPARYDSGGAGVGESLRRARRRSSSTGDLKALGRAAARAAQPSHPSPLARKGMGAAALQQQATAHDPAAASPPFAGHGLAASPAPAPEAQPTHTSQRAQYDGYLELQRRRQVQAAAEEAARGRGVSPARQVHSGALHDPFEDAREARTLPRHSAESPVRHLPRSQAGTPAGSAGDLARLASAGDGLSPMGSKTLSAEDLARFVAGTRLAGGAAPSQAQARTPGLSRTPMGSQASLAGLSRTPMGSQANLAGLSRLPSQGASLAPAGLSRPASTASLASQPLSPRSLPRPTSTASLASGLSPSASGSALGLLPGGPVPTPAPVPAPAASGQALATSMSSQLLAQASSSSSMDALSRCPSETPTPRAGRLALPTLGGSGLVASPGASSGHLGSLAAGTASSGGLLPPSASAGAHLASPPQPGHSPLTASLHPPEHVAPLPAHAGYPGAAHPPHVSSTPNLRRSGGRYSSASSLLPGQLLGHPFDSSASLANLDGASDDSTPRGLDQADQALPLNPILHTGEGSRYGGTAVASALGGGGAGPGPAGGAPPAGPVAGASPGPYGAPGAVARDAPPPAPASPLDPQGLSPAAPRAGSASAPPSNAASSASLASPRATPAPSGAAATGGSPALPASTSSPRLSASSSASSLRRPLSRSGSHGSLTNLASRAAQAWPVNSSAGALAHISPPRLGSRGGGSGGHAAAELPPPAPKPGHKHKSSDGLWGKMTKVASGTGLAKLGHFHFGSHHSDDGTGSK